MTFAEISTKIEKWIFLKIKNWIFLKIKNWISIFPDVSRYLFEKVNFCKCFEAFQGWLMIELKGRTKNVFVDDWTKVNDSNLFLVIWSWQLCWSTFIKIHQEFTLSESERIYILIYILIHIWIYIFIYFFIYILIYLLIYILIYIYILVCES